MISQTAEYALRAVVYLAENPNAPKTIQQIADSSLTPSSYLAKVMHDLVVGGIVRSQRGPGGGFVLSRNADLITLYDIINSVDPIHRIERCPLGRSEHISCLCPLHRSLDKASQLVEDSFRSTTLSDVTLQSLLEKESS